MMNDPDEGIAGADIFRTVWMRSKKNQYAKNEQQSAMRNYDVEFCSIGTTSIYFFSRYHIIGEKFPDFSKNEYWY